MSFSGSVGMATPGRNINGAQSVEVRREIPILLDDLRGAIADLEEVGELLSNRLIPYTVQQPSKENVQTPVATCTDAGGGINSILIRARQLRERLRNLCDNLQL